MPADVSGPPVLLLHGSGPGTTAAAWDPLVAALAPRHRLIAPDLLGFGASPRPAGSLRAAWTRQALALSIAAARPRAVSRVVAVGALGHAMALPAGLDALWAYAAPSPERARELIELINCDPAAASPEAVE